MALAAHGFVWPPGPQKDQRLIPQILISSASLARIWGLRCSLSCFRFKTYFKVTVEEEGLQLRCIELVLGPSLEGLRA